MNVARHSLNWKLTFRKCKLEFRVILSVLCLYFLTELWPASFQDFVPASSQDFVPASSQDFVFASFCLKMKPEVKHCASIWMLKFSVFVFTSAILHPVRIIKLKYSKLHKIVAASDYQPCLLHTYLVSNHKRCMTSLTRTRTNDWIKHLDAFIQKNNKDFKEPLLLHEMAKK